MIQPLVVQSNIIPSFDISRWASVQEYHPRAGILFAALFLLFLLAGVIAYFLGRENHKRRLIEENELAVQEK
jgi:hypothetical protein